MTPRETITVQTRRYYTDGHKGDRDSVLRVTLAAIPGVSVTTDRPETEPDMRTIRVPRPARRIVGAAAKQIGRRRVAMVCAAIEELMGEAQG